MPATSPAPFGATLQADVPFLSEYVLERMLERGEDWAVYLARHATREGGRFRVRVSRRSESRGEAYLARAERLARIAHPGIVPYVTHGVDPDRDLVAVVSRNLFGVTLRERLDSGRKLTKAEVARLVCEAADALDHAHGLQPSISHGALDPARVLLAAPDAGVRLLGFDEAADDVSRPFADQFALASIAYECLAGRAPFAATADSRRSSLPSLDASAALAHTNRAIERVLHRAWADTASQRFATVTAFAEELARLLGAAGAMSAARARRNATASLEKRTSSGALRAPRPPTLDGLPASAATTPQSAPYTPPSGERPAVLPRGPRAADNDERPTNRPPSIAVIERDASAPAAAARIAPPPLPTRASAAPTPPVRTPTLLNVAPPAPAPASIAAVPQRPSEVLEVSPLPAVLAIEPPVVVEQQSASNEMRAATPTGFEFDFDDGPRVVTRSPAIRPARPSIPIPLVVTAQMLPAVVVRPHRRRFTQLAAAVVLALVFGGAEKLAPHAAALRQRVEREMAHPARIEALPLATVHVALPPPVEHPAAESAADAPPAPARVAAHPGANERARLSAAMQSVVDNCATRVVRDQRHARFAVTFEGSSGAATSVVFPDGFFRTHAIGTCIAQGARAVRTVPFSERQWVGIYSIMVR